MKRFLKIVVSIWPFALVAGILMGLFVLRPINDFVAFYEHEVQADSATHYVMSELAGGLQGKKPAKSAFYAVAGGIIGLFLVPTNYHDRTYVYIQKKVPASLR